MGNTLRKLNRQVLRLLPTQPTSLPPPPASPLHPEATVVVDVEVAVEEQQFPEPPPPPASPLHPEATVVVDVDVDVAVEEQQFPEPPPPLVAVDNAENAIRNLNLDLPMVVLEFCLSSAVDLAIQSIQISTQVPLIFHLLRLAMLFAFVSLFVSKYISSKRPNQAQLLEHAGFGFATTGFFLAITISFPICLQLIFWAVYALSLLTIVVCNRY